MRSKLEIQISAAASTREVYDRLLKKQLEELWQEAICSNVEMKGFLGVGLLRTIGGVMHLQRTIDHHYNEVRDIVLAASVRFANEKFSEVRTVFFESPNLDSILKGLKESI